MAALFIVPIAFGVWWTRMRLGFDKRWFVMPARPLISSGFYFALPTVILGFVTGIAGMLLVVFDPRDANSLLLFYITFGFWGTSFIFAYFEPDWLSPEWYRWLKREHGDIIPYLVMDAHEMDRKAWMQRVETQPDLEEWVAEVRRKHGL